MTDAGIEPAIPCDRECKASALTTGPVGQLMMYCSYLKTLYSWFYFCGINQATNMGTCRWTDFIILSSGCRVCTSKREAAS